MSKRIASLVLFSLIGMCFFSCGKKSLYTEGTYTGQAPGFGGDLTVEVEFSPDKIENVRVVSHNESEGISDEAIVEIPKMIVAEQTMDVDVVSGATFVSKAIMEAVGIAINKARGIKEKPVEIVDGVYEGMSYGKGGEIEVAVTIEDSKITSVKTVSHHETIGFERAFGIVEQDMIATNSTDVDTVTSATMASGGMIRAAKDALQKTGFLAAFSKAKGTVNRETLDAEYKTDVVIIGCGGAGINAAIAAKAKGAEVIVIEKAALPGGNTKLADGVLNASETDEQEARDIVDNNDTFIQDTMKGGDYLAKPELVETLVNNSAEAIRETRDVFGVIWEYVNHVGGHSVARSHFAKGKGAQLFETIYSYAISQGIDVKFNTTAKEILKNDKGEVIGVKTLNEGKDVIFYADKGVVLATGGYGQNAELLTKYDPSYVEGTICTNSVLSTGDGIGLAQAAGANLTGMEYVQKHPTCNATTGDLLSSANAGRFIGATIMVNKEGQRYVEELERRDVICNATAKQTGGVSYSFFDQKAGEETEFFKRFDEELNSLIATGEAVKADSLDEACSFFDIDADAFKATLDRYNGFAKDGKDTDFNRRAGLREYSLSEGPFYFIKAAPAVHHTMGGVEINEKAEVIDTKGGIIPNLYAAGEVTGGIHGSNRLGGNAIADVVIFGKIAGTNAAK